MAASRFANEAEAVTYIFRSMRKLKGTHHRGPDEVTRDTRPTIRLLTERDMLREPREYAVVTGSKGKGSTTAITASVLRHIGHTVGMISSPHLVSWRERIRVNGLAIPEADFCRILGDLAPAIDMIEGTLTERQYFSPQGIFLAIALQWFDENNVNAAVLEVGRGGRFDDIAVVPNMVSLFTPIMLEHPHQLGPTLERIAWHKAGIIKAQSFAYSVPQAPEVLDVLQRECDTLDAEFYWFPPMEMGQYLGATEDGLRMSLGRYGEVELGLLGQYQVGNATLAVQAAGNMHARLPGIDHSSPEYVLAVRAGLRSVIWPGRVQLLETNPNVFLDGAINAESAALFVKSIASRVSDPVIAIVGTPDDKDYVGVYRELGIAAETLIITETSRNPSLQFPAQQDALAAARRFNSDARYAPTMADALAQAKALAGREGTIMIAGTQSIVADTVNLYGLSYEQI
jgi:dihydrofolate synthase / folylpolyglutamate synthase